MIITRYVLKKTKDFEIIGEKEIIMYRDATTETINMILMNDSKKVERIMKLVATLRVMKELQDMMRGATTIS